MEIVDAQVHVWEPEHPGRPWRPEFAETRRTFLEHGPAPTIERTIASMDDIGVDVALLTSLLLYDDIDYSLEGALRFPARFRVVPQIDLAAAEPARLVARYGRYEEVVAIRLSHVGARQAFYSGLTGGEYDPVLDAAAESGLPVMLMVWGNVQVAERVVVAYPHVCFVIDHLGIVQGPVSTPAPEPFARLDELLALARFANVSVKVSGVPAVSREAYPYEDLWPHLDRVLTTFGPERLMWGSDFTRTRPLHSYAEALNYLRASAHLSIREKELILGGSARMLLRWPGPG